MTSLLRRKAAVEPKTAQLLLLLGDQQYAVAPVVGTPAGCRSFWLTKLPMSLTTRTVYTVTQRASGHCDCSCPDHQYRHRACKHIRALQALGVLESDSTPPEPPLPPTEVAHSPSCACQDCDPFARVA